MQGCKITLHRPPIWPGAIDIDWRIQRDTHRPWERERSPKLVSGVSFAPIPYRYWLALVGGGNAARGHHRVLWRHRVKQPNVVTAPVAMLFKLWNIERPRVLGAVGELLART